MKSVVPLMVRLARPAESKATSERVEYDCTTETHASGCNYPLPWVAATGTLMTRAAGDPTQDEPGDR